MRVVLGSVLALSLLGYNSARADAALCDTTGAPTSTVYLPNVTKTLGGLDGWDTPFIVQNVGAAPTTLEISFFRFSDQSLVTCRKVILGGGRGASLAPRTAYADIPNNDADLPDGTQFSVVVKSFGAPAVALVNEQRGNGDTSEAAAYGGVSAGALKLALPNVTRRYFGYDTPIIVQNVGSAPTTANAIFRSFDGSQQVGVDLSIGPGRSAVIDPNFTPGLVDGTQYAATITATQPLSAVVNAIRIDGGPGVASAYNALATGANELWGPYFNKNASAPAGSSPVVIQNMGTAETTPQVTVSILTPTPSNCCIPSTYRYTGPPLSAGAAWVLDVRYQACDSCGPAVDLPDGSVGAFKIQTLTHGAVAIDPNALIAAVVLPTSDTTAMAYQARPPATTAFLPNVTRRLGGDSGWTTPIRLAGAGAVTMQWFRLGDGGLVLTQHVGVGTSCCGEAPIARYRAITIDPRDIAELTDDAQYSVTITADAPAPGQPAPPFSVIVTEFADGGDNVMAYEGFASP